MCAHIKLEAVLNSMATYAELVERGNIARVKLDELIEYIEKEYKIEIFTTIVDGTRRYRFKLGNDTSDGESRDYESMEEMFASMADMVKESI